MLNGKKSNGFERKRNYSIEKFKKSFEACIKAVKDNVMISTQLKVDLVTTQIDFSTAVDGYWHKHFMLPSKLCGLKNLGFSLLCLPEPFELLSSGLKGCSRIGVMVQFVVGSYQRKFYPSYYI